MSKPDLTLVEGTDPIRLQAATWFARLRADDVSELERQQWRLWIAENPAHQRAYAQLESLWSAIGEFATAPEVDWALRTSPRIPARPDPAPRAWRRWLAGVAAVLIATAIALPLLFPFSPPPPTSYLTAIGERRSLQLDDGSRVDLDAGSRLEVRFTDSARDITLLQGRALFSVAHETRRPFRVATQNGNVQALGTRFEVSQQAQTSDVSLYQGRVALLSRASSRQASTRLGELVPGQKARLADDHMTVLAQTVEAGGAPAWLNGRLVFNDTPLGEAVAEFNRYSRIPLRIGTPALQDLRISGVFRGEDAEGFVEALREAYGIQEQQAVNGARILRKEK
jgi:transmembrane sensor